MLTPKGPLSRSSASADGESCPCAEEPSAGGFALEERARKQQNLRIVKIEHVVLASLVALVALNGIGLTAQTGQAPTPALKPGPIAIIGKVVEGESMAPVIGATVRLTG